MAGSKWLGLIIMLCLLVGCAPAPTLAPSDASAPTAAPAASATLAPVPTETAAPTLTSTAAFTSTPVGPVPPFEHIVIVTMENKEYETALQGNPMPNLTRWSEEYTLLTEHYAITHPSLLNYMAMIGGDTFFENNLPDAPVDAMGLQDEIEQSGRTWKAYMESMPAPCGLQDTLDYVQKHNPFVWFSSVRNNPERCKRSVVPLEQLDQDIANQSLPNFLFIMPNLCNSAHDCDVDVTDAWLGVWVKKLMDVPGFLDNSLIILTWDEGQGDHTCCGLKTGGGRVATVLISNRVRKGFQDSRPYTHYSLLKTILAAWKLPEFGYAAGEQTPLIEAPFVGAQ